VTLTSIRSHFESIDRKLDISHVPLRSPRPRQSPSTRLPSPQASDDSGNSQLCHAGFQPPTPSAPDSDSKPVWLRAPIFLLGPQIHSLRAQVPRNPGAGPERVPRSAGASSKGRRDSRTWTLQAFAGKGWYFEHGGHVFCRTGLARYRLHPTTGRRSQNAWNGEGKRTRARA